MAGEQPRGQTVFLLPLGNPSERKPKKGDEANGGERVKVVVAADSLSMINDRRMDASASKALAER